MLVYVKVQVLKDFLRNFLPSGSRWPEYWNAHKGHEGTNGNMINKRMLLYVIQTGGIRCKRK